jgi:hypothetical protein
MSPVRREFMTEVSFVVIGSANSIRGLVVGDIGLAVGGLVLMALILTDLAFGPLLRRLLRRLVRRPPGRRTQRVVIALFALAIISDVARCFAAVSHRDWGGCLFYGLRMTAGTGVLTGIATWPSRKVAVTTSWPPPLRQNCRSGLADERAIGHCVRVLRRSRNPRIRARLGRTLVTTMALILAACSGHSHGLAARPTPTSEVPLSAPATLGRLPVARKPTPPRARLSAHVVLSTMTMRAGSSSSGVVIVDNNTGRALHPSGCLSLFGIALANRQASQLHIGFNCLQW